MQHGQRFVFCLLYTSIAGLAFLGGSYMAEAFRSGLEAIEPIQTESAYSLGMNRWQTMRYICLLYTSLHFVVHPNAPGLF